MAGLMFATCCGGLVWFVATAPEGKPSGGGNDLFEIEDVPLPEFRKYQTAARRQFRGAELYCIPLGKSRNGHYSTPGHGGSLYYYLPAGKHEPSSLPCVLITAAGSNLFQGKKFDDIATTEDAAEHLPYVHAGMAVMAYEMDGSQAFETNSEFKAVHKDFKAAGAGMVNARNAFEYILENCPEVNPQQIFAAGHSSAGTAALLFAAHEPRLAGCMAYAPVTNLSDFHPPDVYVKLVATMPSLGFFMTRASPITHVRHIQCPVYIFQTRDDAIVNLKQTNAFVDLLRTTNSQVEMDTVTFGGHYPGMINDGIPAGISWINVQIGRAEKRVQAQPHGIRQMPWENEKTHPSRNMRW